MLKQRGFGWCKTTGDDGQYAILVCSLHITNLAVCRELGIGQSIPVLTQTMVDRLMYYYRLYYSKNLPELIESAFVRCQEEIERRHQRSILTAAAMIVKSSTRRALIVTYLVIKRVITNSSIMHIIT